jgi:hypothetical protein
LFLFCQPWLLFNCYVSLPLFAITFLEHFVTGNLTVHVMVVVVSWIFKSWKWWGLENEECRSH